MNKLLIIILIGGTVSLTSCKRAKTSEEKTVIKKSYIEFAERGLDLSTFDSLPLNNTWKNETILDSNIIYLNKRPIIIRKISNYPNDPIDGGYVAYQEDSLGIFYLKSTTWRSFTLLRTNNDSINEIIDILVSSILANSDMFLNPRQKDFLENKTTESRQK